MSFHVEFLSMPRVLRMTSGALLLLLLALACWVLSGLAWAFHLPASVPLPDPPGQPVAVAKKFIGKALFGATVQPEKVDAFATTSPFRLLGVLDARQPLSARAILQREEENRPFVVGNGTLIDGGITVIRITPRQIVLSMHGREVLLRLPDPSPANHAIRIQGRPVAAPSHEISGTFTPTKDI